MIRYIFVFFIAGSVFNTSAQSKTGLTGKLDTSYTTYSAFKNTAKQFPNIRIVTEKSFPSVKESRNLVYCKTGNRQLKIDAFIPSSKFKVKTPAILIIHGGGWRSGNRTQHIPLAQHLAAAGYASFTVEYRLSTDALFPAAIYDLKAALRWMRANAKKFNLDPSKIAILGFSAGGELAAFVGTTSNLPKFEKKDCHAKYSSAVQAIVDIDGTLSFVHPESGEGDDSRSTSAATYWFGYPKKDNPTLWTEGSPLTHVANNKAPILFLNSSVDRMHAGRDDFRKVLDEKRIYSEVHKFEGAPHSFCLFDPWFDPTVNYITGFLDKVFKK
ncbi:alpha/beta hydrolase [Arcticibacter eurypsychrophilus]|uniref:alpha/beta hydrolase n=1 Tax=Arcticibacter eurypsychrophilus TaxID=1434752 RepID=UPI00084D1BE9|nr:alpha/beta hydrolase [Arcticibacter eurypsychrophilus]